MKIKPYLQYFWFIASHWNSRLAAFTVMHEIRGERKYRLNSLTVDNLQRLDVKGENKLHASIYQGASYYMLELLFAWLKENGAGTSLVDYGSGKGRILVVAAHYGYTDITGIEFAPALCGIANQHIERAKEKFPDTRMKVVCDDALNFVVQPHQTVFFFFNPFDEVIMLEVVKNILQSLRNHPRKIYVVYLNPMHREILVSAGFRECFYHQRLTFLEASIFSNDGLFDQ